MSNLRIGSGSRDTGDIVNERKLENSLLRGMAHTIHDALRLLVER